MSPFTVHAVTLTLLAVTLGLLFRVRQQLNESTERLQAAIDELKAKG